MVGEARRCPCGVDWEGGDFNCPSSVNSPDGFATGDDVGVTGTVKVVRFGGGTIELTIKKGIITEIEDEAE